MKFHNPNSTTPYLIVLYFLSHSLSLPLLCSSVFTTHLAVQMCFRLVQTCNILSQPNGTLNEHQHLSHRPFNVSPHKCYYCGTQLQLLTIFERDAAAKTNGTERKSRNSKKNTEWEKMTVHTHTHKKIQSCSSRRSNSNSSSSGINKTVLIQLKNKLHTCI